MSEREVISLGKDGSTTTRKLTAKDVTATMTKAERKALLARVLDRGVVIDRAIVEVPPEYHYEWVHKDENDIDRLKALGFWVDGEDGHPAYFAGQKRALHTDGTKVPVIGDAVLVICEKETKELLDEIQSERYQRMHGKPGETAVSQREEQKFKESVAGAHLPTPVIEESKARSIHKTELVEALKVTEPKEGTS